MGTQPTQHLRPDDFRRVIAFLWWASTEGYLPVHCEAIASRSPSDMFLLAGTLGDISAAAQARLASMTTCLLTPSREDQKKAIYHATETTRRAERRELLPMACEQLVRAVHQQGIRSGCAVIAVHPSDMDDEMDTQLRKLKRLLPGLSFIVYCVPFIEPQRKDEMKAGYEHLDRLRSERVIAGTLVCGQANSTTSRLNALTLTSLLTASAYDDSQPDAEAVTEDLCRSRSFVSMDCDSETCADITARPVRPARAFRQPAAEVALADVLGRARLVTEQVHRAVHASGNSCAGVMVYTIPLSPKDSRWPRCCDEIQSSLDALKCRSRPLFAPGRTLDVCVSALYPAVRLPGLDPDEYTRLIAAPAPLAPSTTSVLMPSLNGHS